MPDLSQISTPRKLAATAITVFALVALGVSSYLTWTTWQQSVIAGCSGDTAGCDEVLSSTNSKWLGVPVSVFGVLTYAAILAVVWPALFWGGWPMTALLSLSMLATGAGAWFVGLQALVLDHFCVYCLTVHTCGLLICLTTLYLVMSQPVGDDYSPMRAFFDPQSEGLNVVVPAAPANPIVASAVAGGGMLALVAGQMLFAPPTMEFVETEFVEATPMEVIEEPATELATAEPLTVVPSAEPLEPTGEAVVVTDEENLPAEKLKIDTATVQTSAHIEGPSRFFHSNALLNDIDVAANPTLGNPNAPFRFVELMDYTCPHCRKLHPYVKSAIERYGDQLGVVLYHVPLSRKCNPLVKVEQSSHANACDYAKLAYAVWRFAPDQFEEFHDYLMTGKRAPAIHEVKQRAMKLAGEAVFLDKSIETESNRRIGESAAELEHLKVGLPILVFDRGVIRGMPQSEQQWFNLLEQRMGLEPIHQAAN